MTISKILKVPFFDLLVTPYDFFLKLRKPNKLGLVTLLLFAGLWVAISSSLKSDGDYYLRWRQILFSGLLSGCIGGAFLYINAIIGHFYCKILGGKGNVKSMFLVFVYAALPCVFIVFAYITSIWLSSESSSPVFPIKNLLLLLNGVALLWSLYIGAKGIMFFYNLSFLKASLVFFSAFYTPLLCSYLFFLALK